LAQERRRISAAQAKRKETHVKSAHFKPVGALALTLLAVAGCHQRSTPDEAAQGASVAAAPEAKPGISVSDGVLVLPAVKGNPGAAYFVVKNAGASPTTLAAVHVEGAGKAEMHETSGGAMRPLEDVAVPAGGGVTFAQGGKHVMLFDLDPKLAAGSTTEMTLVFAGGDKASAPLRIEAMGGGMADMPGMDHH
jgi:copper(I)-binding protein